MDLKALTTLGTRKAAPMGGPHLSSHLFAWWSQEPWLRSLV